MQQRLTDVLAEHPAIAGLRLVGSRSREAEGPLSDWDFVIETTDPQSVIADLPSLVQSLEPLAALWDPLSHHWTLAVVLEGPVKIDLVVDAPHEFAPVWTANSDPAEIDAHFWDWTFWLGGKSLKGNRDLVKSELAKMSGFLLRPIGVDSEPADIAGAVHGYLSGRPITELGEEVIAALVQNGILPTLPGLPRPGAHGRNLNALLVHELRQLTETGQDVRAIASRVGQEDPGALLDELAALATDEELPGLPTLPVLKVDEETYEEKVLGAWQGRCAGCLLGKPVEGWTFDQIDWYLEETAVKGAFADYLPRLPHLPEGLTYNEIGNRGTLLGEIDGMARDDDIDYPILALLLAERHGAEFTTADVADLWLETLPFHQVYTAERAAMRNLIAGIDPGAAAHYRNPYREWIGALIRADFWGYVNPGDPVKAAELTTRDARLSHTGSGVLAARWSAGLVASCFAVRKIHHALDVARALVPGDSRLGDALAHVDRWYAEGMSFERAIANIRRHFGSLHPVHAVNNATVIAAALRWGDGDFTRSITLCVSAGWDTDSNGATVGSAVGALVGARNLPEHWIAPLDDTIHSAIFGHATNSITDLAARTIAIRRRTR